MERPGRRLHWLTLYAVAMGFLEAVVVVYLRELYYPEGFAFRSRSSRITSRSPNWCVS